MGLKKEKINIDYLRPDSCLIYPLYTEDGRLLLRERVVLSASRISEIKRNYGNIVYCHDTDEGFPVSLYRMKIAYNESCEIMNEISRTDKLSKEGFRKCERVIEEIVSDLNSSEIETIKLLREMKSHEEYLYRHSVNVGVLSAVFADSMKRFTREEVKNIALGAYLIDIGKVKLDKQLLQKNDAYTISDMQKMKRHPQLGYEMLRSIPGIDQMVLQTVLFHHERFSSNGYFQLPYEHLPVFPKIVSACDIYDALTSNRPFRKALDPSDALRALLNAVYEHFDYALVSDFINHLGPMLNNSQSFYARKEICELNTDEMALIRDYGVKDFLKPRVLVFCRFERGKGKTTVKYYREPVEIDLEDDPLRSITKIIDNANQLSILRNKLNARGIAV